VKVEFYGGDQSPWVQAVLLTLYEKDIDYNIRKTPPFEVFRQWIGQMQDRYKDYPYLYSGRYFAPRRA